MLLDAAGLRAHREAETRAGHLLAMLKGQNYRAARTEITALAWVIEPLAVAQDAGEADGPGALESAPTLAALPLAFPPVNMADPPPNPPPPLSPVLSPRIPALPWLRNPFKRGTAQ